MNRPMAPWRILIADGLAEEGQAILRRQAEIVEASDLAALPRFDGLIVRSWTRVTAAGLSGAARRLKVVGRAGVGVDNIDLKAAAAAGVIVVNSPLAATVSVAEHALALMLALARQIPRADAAMRRGEWLKQEIQGSELSGKTLGLIGLGRIGRALAERAAGLGMRVIASDPLVSAVTVREAGAEPVAFETLLATADYVSLHVPLTAETRGMIGSEALAHCRPGARLISTARGGVVDEPALLLALETGRLAGAALDVFAEEPPRLAALIQHPAVISTPHIAAQTVEAQTRAAVDIAEETLAALRGEPLRWRVV